MKRALGWVLMAVAGFVVVAGCSVETQASNVICVADQSDICTDCPPDAEGDPQSGRHLCAHDGKSFGACGHCSPSISALTQGNTDPGAPVTPPPPTTGPQIDASCAGKIGILAGKDDSDSSFTYAAVYNGSTFPAVTTSGAPMKSAAVVAPSGNGIVALYRSKGDVLVATTFTGGAWSSPVGISATSTGTPSLTTWGSDVKAVFRQDDGYLRVATFSGGTWQDALDTIGDTDLGPVAGVSEPSAVSTGAPGVAGASVIVGYTDNQGGLYRQEWSGESWFDQGIQAPNIAAGPFRPEIIPMVAGSLDLVSTYITSDGTLHYATRTSADNGSQWSADNVTNVNAVPLDAPRGLGLSDGRALVVYLDSDRHPQYMIFDASQQPEWSAPAPLFADATVLASTPQLVRDPCGASATLAFATDSGVGILRFADDAWAGPFMVAGVPASTFATPVAALAH